MPATKRLFRPTTIKVGTLEVLRDHTVTDANYETAAWWRKIALTPGRYDLTVEVTWFQRLNAYQQESLSEARTVSPSQVTAKIAGIEGHSNLGRNQVDLGMGRPTEWRWSCYDYVFAAVFALDQPLWTPPGEEPWLKVELEPGIGTRVHAVDTPSGARTLASLVIPAANYPEA